jgi:apolipoprotein N-acyltransferase
LLDTLSQGWRGNILATLAGALITLSLAPFTLWPFGIISCALLVYLLDNLNPAQAAIRGWFYGLGMFAAGASWVYVSIHTYGHASIPLSILLTLLFSMGLALFSSLTCYVYVRLIRNQILGRTLGFAAVIVISEWWRSWFLTGFPWLYLGYAHIDTGLAGWAPVTGIYGVSFIVALSGSVLTETIVKKQFFNKTLLLTMILWLLGFGLNHVNWVKPSATDAVKVAMVQANIDQEIKWNREQYWPTLRLYRHMSAPLWQPYDIVIWPEAAIPSYYHNAKGFLKEQGSLALANNSSLITGIPYLSPANATSPRSYYNSIMAFGDGSGLYHKQRLVPFGEYVPLENLIRGLIEFFDLPMSAFTRGPQNQATITAGGISLAPMICYEVAYPDLVNKWLPNADMLITISNDAWFGASIGPLQHLQMAQMRALENGRYLLRATGNGISAIINQRGKIVVQGEQFTKEIITGKAQVYSGATPFAVTGSWPIIALCLCICISLGLITAKMRR